MEDIRDNADRFVVDTLVAVAEYSVVVVVVGQLSWDLGLGRFLEVHGLAGAEMDSSELARWVELEWKERLASELCKAVLELAMMAAFDSDQAER